MRLRFLTWSGSDRRLAETASYLASASCYSNTMATVIVNANSGRQNISATTTTIVAVDVLANCGGAANSWFARMPAHLPQPFTCPFCSGASL